MFPLMCIPVLADIFCEVWCRDEYLSEDEEINYSERSSELEEADLSHADMIFEREVAETFLRCVKMHFDQVAFMGIDWIVAAGVFLAIVKVCPTYAFLT